MALNKKILSKLAECTINQQLLQEFLTAIFQYESTPKTGWYDKKYCELLENYCKGEKSDENHCD